MGVVEEARAARDAGSAWRARDLLADHVERERDPEALALLAEVLHDMGDLPRAGAMWFATGATGDEVDAAVAAWREQAGDDFVVMWRSLPASVQAEPRPRRVEALRARALAAEADGEGSTGAPAAGAAGPQVGGGAQDADDRDRDDDGNGDESGEGNGDGEEEDGRDAAWLVAWVLAVAFVVFAVIGFVTALGWIVPGG